MKTLLALITALTLLVSSTQVRAEYHPIYGALYGGVIAPPETATDINGTQFDLDYNPGYAFGGSMGTWLGHGFRVEAELGYRGAITDDPQFFAPLEDLTVGAASLMVNGFYEPDLKFPIRPFIGIGGGFAMIFAQGENFAGNTEDDGDAVLAYQGMGGLTFNIFPTLDLFAAYRYFATTNYNVNILLTTFDAKFQSHEFLVGARFSF